MAARVIALFTGNRAEYGLQYPILRAVAADPRLDYRLLAGGAHLDDDFGRTLDEIAGDGFTVHEQVDMRLTHDSLLSTVRAIGAGIVSLSEAIARHHPDALVVYGDRYEAFAAAIAASQLGVATAHVEGGDYTEGGALDDSVRHAMTKLAHLHFATNEQAAERIRRLGEEPWRVFTVGLPSVDLIAAGEFAAPERVCGELGLSPGRPIVLFCQHSVATEADRAADQIEPSLAALVELAGEGCQVVVTYPNNDAGGRRIAACLERLRDVPGIQLHRSLGRYRFHGLLNVIGRIGSGALVGNSSAGIKETTMLGCPVVNIGPRQRGRLRGDNVLDVPYETAAILAAVERCLSDEAFRRRCRTCENPYGAGEAGGRIADVLATVPIDDHLLRKRMTY